MVVRLDDILAILTDIQHMIEHIVQEIKVLIQQQSLNPSRSANIVVFALQVMNPLSNCMLLLAGLHLAKNKLSRT